MNEHPNIIFCKTKWFYFTICTQHEHKENLFHNCINFLITDKQENSWSIFSCDGISIWHVDVIPCCWRFTASIKIALYTTQNTNTTGCRQWRLPFSLIYSRQRKNTLMSYCLLELYLSVCKCVYTFTENVCKYLCYNLHGFKHIYTQTF